MAIATGTCVSFTVFPVIIGAPIGVRYFILAALTFLFVLAVSRMWRVTMVLLVLAMALLFAFVVMNNTEGLYRPGELRTPSILEWMLYLAGIFAVFAPLTVLAVRMGRVPSSEKGVIAPSSKQSSGWKSLLLDILGVHPVCQAIGSKPRRVLAIGLFVLRQAFFALSVSLVLLELTNYFLNIGRRAECFISATTDTHLEDCIGRVIIQLGFLPIGLLLLIGIGAGMRYLARRFSRTSAEMARRHDQRSPILFLRSFSDDQVRLVRPKRGALSRLVLSGEPRPLLDHAILEEGLTLGPVLAIGAPGKPTPFGAVRTYVSDDRWKEVVSGLVKEAQAIVIAVDETPGVQWELNEIHQINYTSKVLHLLPPRLTPAKEAHRIIANIRLNSGRLTEMLEPLQQLLGTCNHLCIGWYVTRTGSLVVLTTGSANEASYRLALRKFFSSITETPARSLAPPV